MNSVNTSGQGRILGVISVNREMSTTRISMHEGVPQNTVWYVCTRTEHSVICLHTYRTQCDMSAHIQNTVWYVCTHSCSTPTICNNCKDFSQLPPKKNILQVISYKMCSNIAFQSCILFTEEAGFSRHGIINFHNQHVWAYDKQLETLRSRHQQQFSLSVWAGIAAFKICGSYILPPNLTGYLVYFLQNGLPQLFQDIKLQTGIHVWFMHDGFLPHFLLAVLEFLNSVFYRILAEWGGPTPWPGCSPDLISLHFICGDLQSLLFMLQKSVQQRIQNGFEMICTTRGIVQQVRQSLVRHAASCVEAKDGHVEHFL